MTETTSCNLLDGSPVHTCEIDARSRRHAFVLGAFVRYPLLESLLIETDLLYAQKGFDVTQPTFHVDYLELPVLVRLDPFRHRAPARVFLEAGIVPALRVHCNDSGETIVPESAPAASQPYSVDCGDNRNQFTPTAWPARFDLGAEVGIGVGWELREGVIELDARYNKGLVDNGAFGAGGKTVNEAIYVMLGFATRVAR